MEPKMIICPECNGRIFTYRESSYRGDGHLQPPDPPEQTPCETCGGQGEIEDPATNVGNHQN